MKNPLLILIPSMITFGPLLMVMPTVAQPNEMLFQNYAGATALCFGLVFLFARMLRQEKEIAELRKRLLGMEG